MNENIVEAIIQNEESRIRFESFCRELIEQLEGVILVPTSYNYDQARDARYSRVPFSGRKLSHLRPESPSAGPKRRHDCVNAHSVVSSNFGLSQRFIFDHERFHAGMTDCRSQQSVQ